MIETLEVLGNLGEFVGALLVAITLIYLTIQTRQANRNTEILKGENFANTIARFNEKLAESDELANIWLKGIHGKETMTPVEDVRFRALWTLWIHYPRMLWVSGDRDIQEYVGWASLLDYPGIKKRFDQSRMPSDLKAHILAAYDEHSREDA